MNILGISAFYHDSAAVLICDGRIVAAAQEERFTRKKHDCEFPKNSVQYCIESQGLQIDDINFVVFYDKPLLKVEQAFGNYLTAASSENTPYAKALPLWLKHKLWMPDTIRHELGFEGEILFTEHHQSHAGSAFYPSPFQEAAILTADGIGEWSTNTLGVGRDNKFSILKEISFPHSLGLLYSAFTYFAGFKVNSGEYKIMALAPYGEPRYVQQIYDNLIDLKEDGTFSLNLNYFNYTSGLTITGDSFADLFNGPRRKPEAPITQREMDLARSIQDVTEECLLRQARALYKETKLDNLCMAGGVILNCLGNGRLIKDSPFKNIRIQPVAGDAGGALGAALCVYYGYLGNARSVNPQEFDAQQSSLLGPEYSNQEVLKDLAQFNGVYNQVNDDDELFDKVAKLLSEGKIVGWMQGRMEFGPRALGNRSILGDPRSAQMQSKMNLRVKFRESFRPFAPSVMREHASEYFEMDQDSPYMLLVAGVKESRRIQMTDAQKKLFGVAKLNVARSDIPAVTHVDYSARIQTVSEKQNSRFYKLLSSFYKQTGCPVLVNTSFNVRGEPIVCSAADAYRCFMRGDMDCLVINNFILMKEDQPKWQEKEDWRDQYEAE
ncbi:MAG: carbamoyltransferase [Bdellovibrionota bacterium]|jgi:carbamoyltransferase